VLLDVFSILFFFLENSFAQYHAVHVSHFLYFSHQRAGINKVQYYHLSSVILKKIIDEKNESSLNYLFFFATDFLVASVAMFIQLVIYAVPSVYGYYYSNPMTYIVAYCKFRMYLIQITSLTYRWAYTAASFDRYALSSSWARLRQLASVHMALRVLGVIFIFWMVFYVYIPIVYNIESSTCGIFNNNVASLFTGISSIINGGVLPFPIMIICTSLIRKNLAEKRRRRQALTIEQQATDERGHILAKREQQALRMLFAQIVVYIIITTPWVIYSINNIISSFIPNKSADRIVIEGFISAVAGAFAFLFPAVSFYLYTLTSSMFRSELLIMLRSLFCCKCFMNNRRIEPIIANDPQRIAVIR
jgi:hypothetical protein